MKPICRDRSITLWLMMISVTSIFFRRMRENVHTRLKKLALCFLTGLLPNSSFYHPLFHSLIICLESVVT